MKKMTVNCYSDPGHSWIKVPMRVLTNLNIQDKISNYSYKRKDFAYLEEDCDYTIFINALKESGIELKVINHSTNKQSKIRSYVPYTQQTILTIGESHD